jgi:type IV pilus assembly protein PilE
MVTKPFNSWRRAAGFTLMELMIALAILGILVAISLPSYQSYIRESHRVDAKITLSRLATLQEQYFFRTSRYTDDFADLIDGAVSGEPLTSDEGYYSIALADNDGKSWTMVATAQDVQAADTTCATLTLTHLGAKYAADNEEGNTSDECWK